MGVQMILDKYSLRIMTITIIKQSLAVVAITLYNAIKDMTFINRRHHTNLGSNNIVIRVRRIFMFRNRIPLIVVLDVNTISVIPVINIILEIVEADTIRIIMINSITIIKEAMTMLIIRGMALQITIIIDQQQNTRKIEYAHKKLGVQKSIYLI